MVIGVTKEIFLLEDDICLNELLTELLVDSGYHVTSFANAEDVLTKLGTGFQPDMIILDHQMPSMSGEEFRRLQMKNALWAKIPTMMLSGDHYLDYSKLGFKLFMPKPFDIFSLLEQIMMALN